ncbi:MAG: DUF2997 domain-containing protein [Proteobacteria bacterium]|nr:DUF2997 domain-containing protein [Pseudomonadota bacterium]MBU1741044.1 DUF2997 domain-containing protein [Pseudomonadota bacterium]
MKQIIIDVLDDGEVKIETRGFVGKSCLDEAQFGSVNRDGNDLLIEPGINPGLDGQFQSGIRIRDHGLSASMIETLRLYGNDGLPLFGEAPSGDTISRFNLHAVWDVSSTTRETLEDVMVRDGILASP